MSKQLKITSFFNRPKRHQVADQNKEALPIKASDDKLTRKRNQNDDNGNDNDDDYVLQLDSSSSSSDKTNIDDNPNLDKDGNSRNKSPPLGSTDEDIHIMVTIDLDDDDDDQVQKARVISKGTPRLLDSTNVDKNESFKQRQQQNRTPKRKNPPSPILSSQSPTKGQLADGIIGMKVRTPTGERVRQ